MKINWRMCSSKEWIHQFHIGSNNMGSRNLNWTWSTLHSKRNCCRRSKKMQGARKSPIRTAIFKKSNTIGSTAIHVFQKAWWVLTNILFQLVDHDTDPSHRQWYMFMHQTLRPLKQALSQVRFCLYPLSAIHSAKCTTTQKIGSQSGHYWHKIPSRSWLSSVLRICTSWQEKKLRVIATETDTTASVVSVAAYVELYPLLKEIPGVPDKWASCSRPEKLLVSRKTEAEGPTVECPGPLAFLLQFLCQLTRPETVQHVTLALLPVTLISEPTRYLAGL